MFMMCGYAVELCGMIGVKQRTRRCVDTRSVEDIYSLTLHSTMHEIDVDCEHCKLDMDRTAAAQCIVTRE